ncbi:gata zinc finger domain-containing protein [Anaeramoeba flamelloides]|uniref:Gata zinc finger domain-containing protein n=1 Tax=Anaeramoeba flamelloides TaxID=1746091 RepID=A0ABQ8ZCP0_9EUKA|nr:gata zinc finger domain-containing protein [Anaeramoeba flamelloides]
MDLCRLTLEHWNDRVKSEDWYLSISLLLPQSGDEPSRKLCDFLTEQIFSLTMPSPVLISYLIEAIKKELFTSSDVLSKLLCKQSNKKTFRTIHSLVKPLLPAKGAEETKLLDQPSILFLLILIIRSYLYPYKSKNCYKIIKRIFSIKISVVYLMNQKEKYPKEFQEFQTLAQRCVEKKSKFSKFFNYFLINQSFVHITNTSVCDIVYLQTQDIFEEEKLPLLDFLIEYEIMTKRLTSIDSFVQLLIKIKESNNFQYQQFYEVLIKSTMRNIQVSRSFLDVNNNKSNSNNLPKSEQNGSNNNLNKNINNRNNNNNNNNNNNTNNNNSTHIHKLMNAHTPIFSDQKNNHQMNSNIGNNGSDLNNNQPQFDLRMEFLHCVIPKVIIKLEQIRVQNNTTNTKNEKQPNLIDQCLENIKELSQFPLFLYSLKYQNTISNQSFEKLLNKIQTSHLNSQSKLYHHQQQQQQQQQKQQKQQQKQQNTNNNKFQNKTYSPLMHTPNDLHKFFSKMKQCKKSEINSSYFYNAIKNVINEYQVHSLFVDEMLKYFQEYASDDPELASLILQAVVLIPRCFHIFDANGKILDLFSLIVPLLNQCGHTTGIKAFENFDVFFYATVMLITSFCGFGNIYSVEYENYLEFRKIFVKMCCANEKSKKSTNLNTNTNNNTNKNEIDFNIEMIEYFSNDTPALLWFDDYFSLRDGCRVFVNNDDLDINNIISPISSKRTRYNNSKKVNKNKNNNIKSESSKNNLKYPIFTKKELSQCSTELRELWRRNVNNLKVFHNQWPPWVIIRVLPSALTQLYNEDEYDDPQIFASILNFLNRKYSFMIPCVKWRIANEW